MSTRFGSVRSGISPVTLVIFILLFLVSGIVAFVIYAGKVRVETELNRIGNLRPEDGPNTEIAIIERQTTAVIAERIELAGYLEGKDDAAVVRSYYDEPGDTPVKDYLTKDFDARKPSPGVKDFSTITSHLDKWILNLSRAEANLKLRVTEATAASETEETARDATRDAYNRRVAEKNAELRRLDDYLRRELATKEALVTKYNDEKRGFADRYANGRDDYERKKLGLLKESEALTQRNLTVRRDLRVLRPEPSIRPPVGHVVRSDWQTSKVVVDVGERERVFPGLVFEVYYFDRNGMRAVKGKLEIMTVLGATSVCNVVESDTRNPIIAGDMIGTRMLPVRPGQKFVIAGFISPDAPYDEEKLKAIIQLNGGIIQDSVGLTTDCLVLGETSGQELGLADLDKKTAEAAPDRARRGGEQKQVAKELSIDVIDYDDFVQGLLH